MGIEIRQLHPLFVGEVSGMDLSRPLGGAGVEALQEAIDRYAVLVFHGQRLSDQQLRDFAGKFGKLEIGRIEPKIGDFAIRAQMCGVGRADDDGRHMIRVQYRPRRDRRDVAAVPHGDSAERRQQALEQVPAAEIIDDQFVLDQRAIGQIAARLAPPDPTLR